jgi:pre-mRNA-splicing factor 38B
MRMTTNQVDLTLKHADSPYIRGIGFLYLRYAGPPEQVWSSIRPYMFDEEEIQVESGHGNRAKSITMAEFVRNLFTARDYHGTPLPRFPIAVERDLQVKLLQAEKMTERAAHHFKNQSRMKYFQTLGSEIMAWYGDEENPPQWYIAIVDRVLTRDEESGAQLKYPRFVVTFPEYGNTETVALGEIDVKEGSWKSSGAGGRSDHHQSSQRGDRGGRGGTVPSDRHLYDEVRRRERDTVTADRAWARRPPSAKTSLSQTTTSRSHSRIQDNDFRPKVPPAATAPKAPPPKRTSEEHAAIADKKRKLAAKYG